MKLHLPMENIHLEGTVSRNFDICPSFYSMKSRKSFDLRIDTVLNRLVQFNVIRRYVKTNSNHTTHRLNALAAPPGIRV